MIYINLLFLFWIYFLIIKNYMHLDFIKAVDLINEKF